MRAKTTGERDATILIPVAGTYYHDRKERVRQAVLWLWSRGIYPGPSAVSLRLRGKATRSINGFETKIRNRVMRELAIPRQRRGDGHYDRLIRPTGHDFNPYDPS